MKNLISLFLIFFSAIAFSQNAEAVLKSLQNKFDSISTLSVDITQKTNAKSVQTGKMFFKKENNLRIEFPYQTIVSNGSTSWNYNKKDKKVIISNYDETGSGLLSINYLIYQYPSECELSLSPEGDKQILILKPKSNRNNMGVVKLYITKENLIDRAIISNKDSGTIEVLFSNYKLNQKLSDSQFTFIPPEGTAVVDLR
ncbi:MAG TPA: outer membrane lipoprotein carrier protein LolA [Ignavibacteriaceae bacterium]|nr:outer membrane lipoprotein carrier protein LolA [Ignavibacteriaceae bacterium]